MSMKLSTQLHQPTWNAQNGPKARLTQVTYPPSSGSDEESSAMTSVTGRLQTRGVRIRSRRARPGPKDETASSMPYGPPLTLKKMTAAMGRSPSSRRRLAAGPPAVMRPSDRSGGLADQRRQPLQPLVEGRLGIHG